MWENKSFCNDIFTTASRKKFALCAPSLLIPARDIPQSPDHVKEQRKAFLAILQERGGFKGF